MAVWPKIGDTVYHPAYEEVEGLPRWFVAEAVVQTVGPQRIRGEDAAGIVHYVGTHPASGQDRVMDFSKAFDNRADALRELHMIVHRRIERLRRELGNAIANLDALPCEQTAT